jgi:beta-galactosidase
MDLCGFPKDHFYYYQSWWSEDRTVLHLFPHWNWEGHEGEEIDVRVFTNCDEVELFVNSRSHGRKTVPRNSHVAWIVRYEPGAIEAIGYRGKKRVATAKRETTGPAARLVLEADRMSINADGADVAFVTVSAVDSKGRLVPTANDLVQLNISGAGAIIGIGNGDPSSHEPDKAAQRTLFNGLACAIVQSTSKGGPIRLAARAAGLKSAMLTLQANPAALRPSI